MFDELLDLLADDDDTDESGGDDAEGCDDDGCEQDHPPPPPPEPSAAEQFVDRFREGMREELGNRVEAHIEHHVREAFAPLPTVPEPTRPGPAAQPVRGRAVSTQTRWSFWSVSLVLLATGGVTCLIVLLVSGGHATKEHTIAELEITTPEPANTTQRAVDSVRADAPPKKRRSNRCWGVNTTGDRVRGECRDVSDCPGLATPEACPGPATVQCCISADAEPEQESSADAAAPQDARYAEMRHEARAAYANKDFPRVMALADESRTPEMLRLAGKAACRSGDRATAERYVSRLSNPKDRATVMALCN